MDSLSAPGWVLWTRLRTGLRAAWAGGGHGRLGCPSGFHRISGCHQTLAGGLQHSPAARPWQPSPAPQAIPASALPNQLSPDQGNKLGSRTGNWICTRRRGEKLMFCGTPPQRKCFTSLSYLQAMRNENKRNGIKAPYFFFLTFVWGKKKEKNEKHLTAFFFLASARPSAPIPVTAPMPSPKTLETVQILRVLWGGVP